MIAYDLYFILYILHIYYCKVIFILISVILLINDVNINYLCLEVLTWFIFITIFRLYICNYGHKLMRKPSFPLNQRWRANVNFQHWFGRKWIQRLIQFCLNMSVYGCRSLPFWISTFSSQRKFSKDLKNSAVLMFLLSVFVLIVMSVNLELFFFFYYSFIFLS